MEADSQGEYAGGLYVRWNAPELGEAGMRAVAERQDPAAPEWKRHAEVVLLMQTALIGILRLAGFSVVRPELVVEVGVDVTRDASGRWRNPARWHRARPDLSPADVPHLTPL
ncbi:hypothetical protein [Streptomyces sp. NPDC090798]|uniref:hypothetical protein n=1 Tax=Streptomyces sp. NPDC090798 TaxID=3365968 RepID=UPI0038126B93